MASTGPSLRFLLAPFASQEQDPAVQSVLTDVLHTSLRQCGAIGLVGTLLHVGVSALGLGYSVRWTYKTIASAEVNQVVVMGTLIVAALSVMALVLAQMRCRLRTGRGFGAAAVLLTATVAMFEGALRGTFGTVYVVPAYLVIVAIIPFRPRQVLAVGGAVTLIVYAFGPTGPVWNDALTLSPLMATHLAFVGGSAVLVTATSGALYRRHLSFGRAQAELQKNRDLLRRVQEVARVGGWEYDPETDTVQGTRPLHRLLDVSPDRNIGREDGLSIYPPAARDRVARAIDRCLTEGDPFALEVPLDAGASDEPRWARVRGQAQRRNGRAQRLTGTLQDITEQKHREQALQRERDRFETLFEHLPTPVVHCTVADGVGTIQRTNQAFESVFGHDPSDLEGEALCGVLDTDNPNGISALVERALTTPAQQIELPCHTTQGPRHFALHFAVHHRPDGDVEGYAMFVDITEQKRRERELKESKEAAEKENRMKSTFLANMSHEIRTPLTSILGFSEAIEEAVRDPDAPDVPIQEFSRRISEGGERLLETLDSVLNLSELEAGAMEFPLGPINLTAEARDVVTLFEREAQNANIALHSHTSAPPVHVRANQGALRRVQRNLLSNALKYTDEGGTVVVRVRETPDAGVLEVEDNGIGMHPDEVDDLFNAFKQASTGSARVYEGSGLGLAVVERLVDRMDGTIDVTTEKGEGTTFTVRLPRAEAPPNGAAPSSS